MAVSTTTNTPDVTDVNGDGNLDVGADWFSNTGITFAGYTITSGSTTYPVFKGTSYWVALDVTAAGQTVISMMGTTNAYQDNAINVYPLPMVALPTVDVAAAAASVAEGSNAEFAFTLSANAAAGGVTIPFTLAHAGKLSDASVTSGSVTIAAGSSAATHRVATIDDRIDEDDGSITLTLGTLPATHTAGSSNSAIVAVTDNDDPPFIVINDPSVLEGGGSTLQFAFRLVDGAGQAVTSDKEITVMFATTADGTATAGTDFTARSGTATFTAGLGSVTRGISPIDDMDSEGNETVVMQLSMPVNAGFQGGAATITGTGTIIDDEMPVVTIAADSGSVTEGADAVFILSLSEAHTAELAVPVTVAQTGRVTAATGERTVAVPQGAMEARFTVAITDDNTDEADGSVTATIGALPATHAGADGSASVTVQDDEAPPVITVMDGGGAEGGTAVFPLRLAPASGAPDGNVSDFEVTVSFAASRETGDTAVAGTDFEAVMGVVTFAPGAMEAEARVNLPMADADLDEATFSLTLSGPMNATFAGGGTAPVTAVGRVLELPGLGIVADDADGIVSEGEMAVFTVSLSRVPDDGAAVVVPVTVATMGSLHGALPDSVTIPAGQLSVKLTIPLDNDGRDEADGSMTVTISLPAGREAEFTFSGAREAMLAVTDDDDAPSVSVLAAPTAREGDALMFPVELSGASEREITVIYTTEAGDERATATAGEDYDAASGTLTFAANETRHVMAVPTRRDTENDPDEVVVLTISEPANATLGTASAAGVISEGLSDDEIDALNEAILPHVIAAVAEETAGAVQDRVRAAFEGGGGANAKGLSIRGASPSRLLDKLRRGEVSASDFDFSSNLNGDGAAAAPLTLWGRGYYRDLSVDANPIEFDGDVTGFTLGADARLSETFLAGVAVGRAVADMSWDYSDLTGKHETAMTGIHPYFGWRLDGGLLMWGSVGYGQGELELTEERSDDFLYERDLSIGTVALGGYGPLPSAGPVDFGIVADFAYTRTDSDAAAAAVETGWLRAGAEADYNIAFSGGGAFGVKGELTLREDFGDAKTGTGVELGAQVDYRHPAGLRLDLKARALLGHRNDDEVEEWGISGGIAFSTSAGGQGFALSFRPEWGATATARDQLWNGAFAAPAARAQPALRYNLELQYGIPIFQGRELLNLRARSDLRREHLDSEIVLRYEKRF